MSDIDKATVIVRYFLPDATPDLYRRGLIGAIATALAAEREAARPVIEAARRFLKLSIDNARVNDAICREQQVWGARWNLGAAFDVCDTAHPQDRAAPGEKEAR